MPEREAGWTLIFSNRARKDLRNLDRPIAVRILDALQNCLTIRHAAICVR